MTGLQTCFIGLFRILTKINRANPSVDPIYFLIQSSRKTEVKGISMLIVTSVAITFFFNFCICKRKAMEGFIVDGEDAAIDSFPHSAYMSLSCVKDNMLEKSKCGAAIVNQWILLTAAHCFDSCQKRTRISFYVGHEYVGKGIKVTGLKYVAHPQYSMVRNINDVALVKVKTPISFSSRIGRVVLMKNPPHNEMAFVAGWGFIDDVNRISSNTLQYTSQKVMSLEQCYEFIGPRRPGVFCAGHIDSKGYVAPGDSGSALVVRQSIHIGIVSYKIPSKSATIAVYTDTSYYYDWIVNTTKKLQCEAD